MVKFFLVSILLIISHGAYATSDVDLRSNLLDRYFELSVTLNNTEDSVKCVVNEDGCKSKLLNFAKKYQNEILDDFTFNIIPLSLPKDGTPVSEFSFSFKKDQFPKRINISNFLTTMWS